MAVGCDRNAGVTLGGLTWPTAPPLLLSPLLCPLLSPPNVTPEWLWAASATLA
ncbi:hypothetical protein H7J50_00015 [Mycobacterium intermedium]|uniref:hypothetical protein n=1 Tax=Mycobacterium intermedium TaxID=28445 RepID=UPI0012E9C623|nr:hypothetical protein [Mycobacterium intermedium]MCV6962210.1 hypothetical protein [Mycobacterium intermedium]